LLIDDIEHLPKLPPGRPSPASRAEYKAEVEAFAEAILELKSGMDFSVSARGWGYILENHVVITKGELDAAERLINALRKNGTLPLDICAEDVRRQSEGEQRIDGSIEDELAAWERGLRRAPDRYTPTGFWDEQDVYIELGVEKIDLRNLFAPVCDEFFIQRQNLAGWSDLWARARILMRFYEHWPKRLVYLWCGDHDPGGLQISDFLRANFRELAAAVAEKLGVDVDEIEQMIEDIEIDRFGLNADFIEDLGLVWIDNLETSSGRSLASPGHPDHSKPYVQNYIRRYGVRKCEANALVVRPDEGRELLREAILRYLYEDAPEDYRASLAAPRAELRSAINRRFNLDGGTPPSSPPPVLPILPPAPPPLMPMPPPALIVPAPPRLILTRPTRSAPPRLTRPTT
jgi:hypothetical protein